MRPPALLFLAFCLLARNTLADEIVLEDGSIEVGDIVGIWPRAVEIRTPAGVVAVEKSKIRKIQLKGRQLEVSRWGWGFELGVGYGAFTGSLAENFSDNIPLATGFEVGYDSWRLRLNVYIGFGITTRQAFTFNGNWKQDLAVQLVMPQAAVGHAFSMGKDFMLIPFIGIASMHISPPERIRKEPGNDVAIPFTTAIPVGLDFDFNIPDPTDITNKILDDPVTYFTLRLRVGYVFGNLGNHDPRFDGNMVYFLFSFAGFFRGWTMTPKKELEVI
ncbi:MAG: hypothetical protein N2Z22_05125 [Turneriella sp.]|nr:hypothetical protein [Turneriella sp.]